METPKGPPAPKPPGLVLLGLVDRSLAPGIPSNQPMAHRVEAYPDEDGNFSLDQVYPGAYRMLTARPPQGYYLDAVRVGEAEPFTPEVERSPGASLTLVYKTNGGTVRGTVEKCAAGWVVLVPQDPARRWPDALREVGCDGQASGSDRYEITAVRPGQYYVLALSGNGAAPFLAPNF